MACKIIKDKTTNEEFLIPDCWGVISKWHLNMSDREIIKTYCDCRRRKEASEKYETHTKDELMEMVTKLEDRLSRSKIEVEAIENELDVIKSEIFMLNTVEVFTK